MQITVRHLPMLVGNLRHWISPSLAFFLCCVIGGAVTTEAGFWWAGLLGSFIAMLVIPLLLLVAIGMFFYSIYKARKLRSNRAQGLGMTVANTVGACLSPLVFAATLWLTGWFFDWSWLAAHHSAYSRIIALAQAGQLPAPGKTAFQTFYDGTDFEAERNYPNRIAFPFPGGFLNNWQGILYDPNGVGLRINATQKDGKPGDLLDNWWTIGRCAHMVGHFFSCSFS